MLMDSFKRGIEFLLTPNSRIPHYSVLTEIQFRGSVMNDTTSRRVAELENESEGDYE